jgi:sugar phosphate isomerase/epimerase
VRASMTTLTWMTFPEGEAGPPYGAAPVLRLLEAARGAGFGEVGFDLVTLGGPDAELEPEALADLGTTDIGVLRVGGPDTLANAAGLARAARRLGAPVCSAVLEVAPSREVLAQLCSAAELLQAVGARLALEFMAYGPLGDLATAVRVCDAVGWERCGLLLDSWHLMHARTPWDEVAALTPEQVALVQVSDTERLAEDADEFFRASRWGRVPPGEGRLDFAPFLEALGSIGYAGTLAPEVLGYGARYDDPAECATRLRRSVELLGAS